MLKVKNEPLVVIDCQCGLLSREVPDDVMASMVNMSLPQMYFNLDVHGEAFNDRFLVMTDWRSEQHQYGEVTKQ